MGSKQSVYERSATLDYVRLTSEQRIMIKNAWSDIENNPQFYGNAFFSSFLETYPHYIKFYTLEPNRALNLDARTAAKFKMIMEALGYLLLDFHNKPKQLDRLVGYIAMKHKDMRLEKQDMFNFGHYLLGYLAETFPTKMSPECREAMTNFLVNILHEMCRKMEAFREYETANSDGTKKSLRLPCGECMIFGEGLIFGQTRAHWNEWKNVWDARLTAWLVQDTKSIEPMICSSTDEEDVPLNRFLNNNDPPDRLESSSQPHRKVSIMPQAEHIDRDVSASRLALQTLTRRLGSKSSEQAESIDSLLKSGRTEEDDRRRIEMRKPGMTARERYRSRSLACESINSQPDAIISRGRILSSNTVSAEKDKPRESLDDEQTPMYTNPARERRRKNQRFSFDLK